MDSKKPEYEEEAKDTTLHVSGKKKEWLEKKAYKLSMETKKIYTWRDLYNYTIDKYVDEAIQDLIHEQKK